MNTLAVAAMAAKAAYRAGAGLVYIACPARVADILSIKQDCAVVWPFDEKNSATDLLEYSTRCDVAIIGPGLSQQPEITAGIRELVVGIEIPFVLDADGLNAFRSIPELLARGNAPRVLTPHPGEAARLLQRPIEEIQKNREAVVKELANNFLSVAVLKGHRTLVSEGKKIYRNKTGNPGMATGGSGDVLAGIIGALIGQKMTPWDAACLGVEIHGRAGDIAAKEVGQVSLMATDILDALPRAFKKKR